MVDHLRVAQLVLAAVFVRCRKFLSVEYDPAFARREKTGDDPGKRALTGAGLTHNSDGSSPPDLKVDVGKHIERAVAGGHELNFQKRLFLGIRRRIYLAIASDRKKLARIVFFRLSQHVPASALLDQVAVAEDHDAVGHLGDHCEIMGNVDRRRAIGSNGILDGGEDFNLGGNVEGRGGFVEDDEIRLAGHSHGGHRPLQLPAGNLMRIAETDFFRVRQPQPAKDLDRVVLGLALCSSRHAGRGSRNTGR